MAMDVGSSRGGLNSNINVTPLVDVMLVLLIIMMLIAPMLQKGVPVTLPQANNGEQKPDTQDQTVVSIDSRNQFWVNGLQVLEGRIRQQGEDGPRGQEGEDRPHQGGYGRPLQRDHGSHGCVARGEHRGYRLDYGSEESACWYLGRKVAMKHAHKHFGADRVVTGEVPHASADMNVTPLIDVLLVLLIIFMAALPLTQRGMDINLPLEAKTPQQATPDTQVVLDYNADHSIAVNKQIVQLANLETFLRDVFETRKEKTMFIIGDPNLRYGEIVAVIDAAKGAGVTKVGIVTEGMRKGDSQKSGN